MKKLEEEIKRRFSEEIAALKVSKSTIAEKIGLSSNIFLSNALDMNLPGMLLLSCICKKYPNFDSTYVLTGIRKDDNCEILRSLQDDISFKKDLLAKMEQAF